jgi:hypothetical protein
MTTVPRSLRSSSITMLAAIAAVLASSCGTGMYGFTYQPSNSDVLRDGRFAVVVNAPPRT